MNVKVLFCASAIAAAVLHAAESESFQINNEAEFRKCVAPDARLQKLATDMAFLEGPAWHPAGFLVFSDIPNDELKKWTLTEGVTTFRKPSHNANGNTIDTQRRLVTAEHSGRRIAVADKGGVTTLVSEYNGKRFNSPNDVVVKSDGTVWFTDPPYGLSKGETKEQEGNYVFRFDPQTKRTTVVATNCDMPNGLAFSPDERKLYVADSSGSRRHIRVYDVQPHGTLQGGNVFCQIDKGGPDGIRCDAAGRVWSSAGDGVQVFGPNGSLVGKILVPESPANLCFGGADGRTLFITARNSLYSIPVLVGPAKRP